MLPPKPAAGSGRCFAIAQSARLCKKVQWPCTCVKGRRGGITLARCPVYGDYGCENLLQAVFSFSKPLISGHYHPLSSPK